MTETATRKPEKWRGCDWPMCDHADDPETAVMLSDDGGESQWCLCHFGDDADALPRITTGHPLDQCARCGKGTSEATDAGVPLHVECRRIWAMAQSARPPMGAYARKASVWNR